MSILTKKQHQSDAWQTLKNHMIERVESLRKENDKTSPDIEKDKYITADRRARIAELKRLIADDKTPLKQNASGEPFD